MSNSNWTYIDEIEVTDNINAIHVDTRDFHCFLSEERIDLRDRRYPQITRCLHKREYLIKAGEIKEWLKMLETISGGKGDWRMITFRNIPDGGWFKYIRLYRVKGGDFIVCQRDSEPVNMELMTEENLKKDDYIRAYTHKQIDIDKQ